MNRIVVITGASSGIGEATAKKFAKDGDNLILLARRKDKLELIKREILEKNDINVLVEKLDVRNRNEVFNFFNNLQEEWKTLTF